MPPSPPTRARTPTRYTDALRCSQLAKYQALNNFEQQTNVPKVYVVLGLAALYLCLIFFNIAGEFLVNFAGFLIPGYYSLEALFSVGKSDDTQVSPVAHGAAACSRAGCRPETDSRC